MLLIYFFFYWFKEAGENISLTCDAVIAAGSASFFTVKQLQSLRDEDINDCLYELGANYLTIDQATIVWNRVKEVTALVPVHLPCHWLIDWTNIPSLKVYGELYRVPLSQQLHLGWILRGLDSESISQFRLDDLDLVAALGSADFQLIPHQVDQMLLYSSVCGWFDGFRR